MSTHKINSGGFQLIQLVMVCAIIGIMAVIGVPVFTRYQPNIKLNAEAKQLISDLRYAQQKTVSEQKIYYIEIDIPGKEYSIIKQETPATPIKTIVLDPEITFQEVSDLTDNKVVFNSFGAVSEAGEIILANSQESIITINIKPSGHIQMLK